MLLLDIRVQFLVNKLIDLRYPKYQLQVLLSTSSGDISGILLPFTNVFKMVQYVLGVVFRSLSLLARRSWYFSLEELIYNLIYLV